MLDYSAILDGAERLLVERFPGAPVYRDRTPKDFARTSFLVTFDAIVMDESTPSLVQVEPVLMVTGFPSVDGYGNAASSDLLTVMASIQELFADGVPVLVDDKDDRRVLHRGVITGQYEADYVTVKIPLSYMDHRPQGEEWPLMGDVSLTIKTI